MKNERFHVDPASYQKYEERSIEKGLKAGIITPHDANLIKSFAYETGVTNNLSPARRFKLVTNLMTSYRFLPPVEKMNLSNVFPAIYSIQQGKRMNGKKFTQNTIADLIRFSKRYLIWLAENGHISIPIEKIRKIKTPAYNLKTKSDEDILTEDEVKKLIQSAKSIRYRALLGVMYEAGLRSSEIASLQWQDVIFFHWGARIKTSGKTGKSRSIPIIVYHEFLAQWRATYPGTPEGENFVFVNMHLKPLQYRGLAKTLDNFRKAAGIERKITLHTLRHSRITHALRGGLQETQVKKTFWGNESTDMIAVYCHLVDEDADRAFAKLAGVELPGIEPRSKAIDPIQCKRCTTINPPGIEHCIKCGLALTKRAQMTYDSAISNIEEILGMPGGIEILGEALARLRERENTALP